MLTVQEHEPQAIATGLVIWCCGGEERLEHDSDDPELRVPHLVITAN
jgi:hypothetical protein